MVGRFLLPLLALLPLEAHAGPGKPIDFSALLRQAPKGAAGGAYRHTNTERDARRAARYLGRAVASLPRAVPFVAVEKVECCTEYGFVLLSGAGAKARLTTNIARDPRSRSGLSTSSRAVRVISPPSTPALTKAFAAAYSHAFQVGSLQAKGVFSHPTVYFVTVRDAAGKTRQCLLKNVEFPLEKDLELPEAAIDRARYGTIQRAFAVWAKLTQHPGKVISLALPGDRPLPFADMLAKAKGTPLFDAIDSIADERAKAQSARYLAAAVAAVGSGVPFLAFEWGGDEGSHGFVLLVRREAQLEITTNVEWDADAESYEADARKVRQYLVPLAKAHAKRFADAVARTFAQKVGGDAETDDGDVYWITVQTKTARRRAILYGVDFPLDPDVEVPTEKAYLPLRAGLELWRSLLGQKPPKPKRTVDLKRWAQLRPD